MSGLVRRRVHPNDPSSLRAITGIALAQPSDDRSNTEKRQTLEFFSNLLGRLMLENLPVDGQWKTGAKRRAPNSLWWCRAAPESGECLLTFKPFWRFVFAASARPQADQSQCSPKYPATTTTTTMTPIIVKTFMFMLRLPQSCNQKTLNVTKQRWQARRLLMSLRMTLKNHILLENYWRLSDLEALHRR